jgi:RHS repeat-associated protein
MRLVKVPLTGDAGVYGVYRAQGDTSAAQYERMNPGQPYFWRVRHTDGSVMYFGEPSHTTGCTHISEGYAPLTTVRDVFGNEISYEYGAGAPDECRIERITWGQNTNAGLPQPFASVMFSWRTDRCQASGVDVWTGAQLDFRTGAKIVTGASKLTLISIAAFDFGAEATPLHTRTISLGYINETQSCTAAHAPVRLLGSINETAGSANAPAVSLPPITFDYGTPNVALSSGSTSEVPWRTAVLKPFTLGWGNRAPTSARDKWPTVEETMIDLDGDGLLDRLFSTFETSGQCTASWARNPGPSSNGSMPDLFDFGGTIALPQLRWHGDSTPVPAQGGSYGWNATPYFESCALNGQATAYRNILPGFPVGCHQGSSVAYSQTPGHQGEKFCYGPNEFGLQIGTYGFDPEYRTYLGYRWLDVTGDGLVDLVAAVQGTIDAYDIVEGNDPTLTNDPEPFGPWPACPTMDRCKQLDPQCLAHAGGDQTAIDACIASAPSKACGQIATTVYTGLPGQPNHPAPPREPYTRCEGLYPWFVFENQGDGTFPSSPRIIYSPVELESETGLSPAIGPLISSQDHAVVDYDGDGILDALKVDENSGSWQIWLGDGTGGFEPKRYLVLPSKLPTANKPFEIDNSSTWANSSVSGQGLLDFNGDGLVDHWELLPVQSGSNIALHDGTGFDVFAQSSTLIGRLQTTLSVGDMTAFNVTDWESAPGGDIDGGTTKCTRRMVDADADGRVDLVGFNGLDSLAFFNLGGQLRTDAQTYAGDVFGRDVTAYAGSADITRPWEQLTDLLDLNGDGIPEAVSFSGGLLSRTEHAVKGEPPRLLKSIDNGRGAVAHVIYASMHDPDAVSQDPDAWWWDGRPKASPSNQWVVKRINTTDTFSNPVPGSTTSYFYKNPRHGKNDEGHYGFRGFEEVTMTAPSSAKTVSRYDYEQDWSGRLVETRIHPAEAPGEVRSIDRTQWTGRPLFGGAITTHHATVREHFTCANGQTLATCTATSAPGYTRTVIEQTAFNASGTDLLWQDTATTLQAGESLAEGDRRTEATYTFVASPTMYRFRPDATTRLRRANGGWLMFGKSATKWDPDLRVPLQSWVWVDADDNHATITEYKYYPDNTGQASGNVSDRWKPEQNGGSTRTHYDYDSRKLFVATQTNELGHVRQFTYDYGTGAKLVTTGPNEATCGATCPANAPPGSICLAKEQHETRIDSLGRPISLWDTVSDDGCTYYYHERSTTSYVEANPATSTPASITNKVRIDAETSVWTEEKTEIDGHGRPIKKTTFVQGTAPADQISTFAYDTHGNLTRVEVPDPSANSAARVAYTYGYDSLGRATSLRRPDAAAEPDKSGVDIVYDGLTTTTTEETGIAGGNEASTRTIKDRFGRLVQVEERTRVSPTPAWATTTYSYGPDDQVMSVVDPEGVTTAMVHDFAGRRTRITRHGRSWCYGYDKNGNLESEEIPGPNSSCTGDINYTTSIVYDALDRPISKVVGQRELSAPDQSLFGGNTETFTYDLDGNMKGQLRFWKSFGPGASTPALEVALRADNQGRRTYTGQTLEIAGYPTITRELGQDYYLFGGSHLTHYFDQVTPGGNATVSSMSYDARGLPSSAWIETGTGPILSNVAVQTRNVAGLVTKRRSSPPAGGPMNYVASNWTYDVLGRVVSQVVQKDPAPAAIASQVLQYNGNDDPSWLNTTLGSTSRPLQLMYDQRHQLKRVASNTAGFFNAAYEFGDAGRFTRVWESQTISPTPEGSEVKSRYVDYRYENQDPEQLTKLVDVDNGSTYATFTYDAAGNQRTRCLGPNTPTCTAELLEYVYDGKDQLRRVTKKNAGAVQGSEEYWYNGSGSRVAIVRRDAAGNKTELITFTGETEAHYDGTGAIEYVYSHASLGTPFVRVKRTDNTTADVEYQFHGLASSTLAAVASDGTLNANFVYTPFGSVAQSTNSGGASGMHSRRHNDKFVDSISGLAYYGARYYDRLAIGWTQADPLYVRYPDSTLSARRANIYTFSLQNPLRYMDPDGLDAGDWGSQHFFATCHANSVCAAGQSVEAPEPASFAGETSTTALRTMIGLGIAQKRSTPQVTVNASPIFKDDSWVLRPPPAPIDPIYGRYCLSGCEIDWDLVDRALDWLASLPTSTEGAVIDFLWGTPTDPDSDKVAGRSDEPKANGESDSHRTFADNKGNPLPRPTGGPGRPRRRRSSSGGNCSGPNSDCARIGGGHGTGSFDDPENPGFHLCYQCRDKVLRRIEEENQ